MLNAAPKGLLFIVRRIRSRWGSAWRAIANRILACSIMISGAGGDCPIVCDRVRSVDWSSLPRAFVRSLFLTPTEVRTVAIQRERELLYRRTRRLCTAKPLLFEKILDLPATPNSSWYKRAPTPTPTVSERMGSFGRGPATCAPRRGCLLGSILALAVLFASLRQRRFTLSLFAGASLELRTGATKRRVERDVPISHFGALPPPFFF